MSIERKNIAMLFPNLGKFSMVIFALLLLISGFRAYEVFGFIFSPNVKKNAVILIPTGSDFNEVYEIIKSNELLNKENAFNWVAKKKKYKENIKPGRYEIEKGWNTNQLVNLLRAGNQSPIKVTFNNVRNFNDLAGKIAIYFETDSITFSEEFTKDENYKKHGFTKETFSAMFIPNTYEFYWTNTPSDFISKMKKEYHKFWNEDRLTKAKSIELSPVEVCTLASIVQEETVKMDEKAKVAGLYLNRLKRGMLLQADPTIKFAINDFSIRRVTSKMLTVDSPYNTYKYSGLPPGPVNFPEISSIDAVLNAENHDYLYMCAKEDFSGYHNFARNLTQHNINAARYHRELNKNKIWR